MSRLYVSIACCLLASSCITHLKSGAERIIVSRTPAPKGCKYQGQVMGSQGNAIVGGVKSNRKLALGAMNDLRNEALALGANYVQLETNQAGMTGGGGTLNGSGGSSLQMTDVTNVGNAYTCNPEEIGL